MLSRRGARCLAGLVALLGGATPVWPQGEGIPGGDPGSGFYSAADLARIGCVLACHGQLPDGQRLFPAAYGRFVNANLMTCGMYDGSGDFAIRVGVPAKSGVGGGIMAVVPGRMGVGLFGPALDEKGNSLAGIRALELLSARLNLSVF